MKDQFFLKDAVNLTIFHPFLYIQIKKIKFFDCEKCSILFDQPRVYKLVIFLEFTLFSIIFSCFSAKLRSLTFLTFSVILSYFCFTLRIAINSSWLISMSINAWDTKVSILLSLLLANIKILLSFSFCILLYLAVFLLFLVKLR